MTLHGSGREVSQVPARPARRETERTGGELAVVDQGGGVLVHAHSDHGAGVAKPPCYGTNGDLLGEQPDGVGVAQVVEAGSPLVGSGLVQFGADRARCQTRAKLADVSGPPGPRVPPELVKTRSRARPPTRSRWVCRVSIVSWSRAMVRPPGRERDRPRLAGCPSSRGWAGGCAAGPVQ
jgi:hypothetical protein